MGEARIRLGWADSASDFEAQEFSDSNSTGWQHSVRYITTPDSAGDLRLILLTDGELFVDNIIITEAPAGNDTDGDGVLDGSDNCPLASNVNQADADGDSMGDSCDSDIDGDGVLNSGDCLPFDNSAWQNRAFPDADQDGVRNSDASENIACFGQVPGGYSTEVQTVDNCPDDANPGQSDYENDGIGDACDPDTDNDQELNETDCAPFDSNKYVMVTYYPDLDKHGFPSSLVEQDSISQCATPWTPVLGYTTQTEPLDNCPEVLNWEQTDTDGDGIGDDCDATPNGEPSSSSSDSSSEESSSSEQSSSEEGSSSSSSSSQASSSDSSEQSSSSSSDVSSSSQSEDSTSSSSSTSSSQSSESSSSSSGETSSSTSSNSSSDSLDTDDDRVPDSIDNDDDNDGLSDAEEYYRGTDRLDSDTDDDDVSDGQEAIILIPLTAEVPSRFLADEF